MKYLLDSNTYIQAKNQYYGMDICPAYWEWLDQQFAYGELGSINMIGEELKAGDDELAEWAKDRPDHFITNDDNPTQQIFTQIAAFVMAGNYNSGNRDHFLAKADPWIIAKAKSIGATVVSHESRLEPNTKKVKVPNICQEFAVPCISTHELLRALNAKFVLGS
ncbi:DUF4411 family protein [Hydrogenovibrio sp. JE_KL2]|uniref:DUF4411 family protein n=1 Tax=Hydrogenovibrio sp. JE_KL2 TaxID=2651188 RepID=UPI00128BBEC9|nr:DUF4411 family protein [Hydrogenovibrio sp. JE_KL2]MPQ75765.1 DUF4411 family protein [Hydrogenovibrio sp. JE_KL2]